MAKRVGITFSDAFGVKASWMEKNKVFNPTLDVDSPLFIDPFLLPHSAHPEFKDCGFQAYEGHFTKLYRSIRGSVEIGDKAWKGALKDFQFGEIQGLGGTCLGYSTRTDGGRAFGPKLSARALLWAKNVIDLGVRDPELFSSMALFEEGIGPDRISDMVTKIILDCLLQFNARMHAKIKKDLKVVVPVEEFKIAGRTAMLPVNPAASRRQPVILVASDVLKHLPLMDDPRGLAGVAEAAGELRDRVNEHISEIFKIRTKAEKEEIKKRAMVSAQAFQALLDVLKLSEKTPYDMQADPYGLLAWADLAQNFTALHKLEIKDNPKATEIARINHVCETIIRQFQTLVEDMRLSRTFHVNGKPRHERYAQLLFYAIAVAYCDANDLDISPESDAGAGPVDFKFSRGVKKVVVEVKLSTNQAIVSGYKKQITAYMNAERAERGHYVVIDVGGMGEKWDRLVELTKEHPEFAKLKPIHLIDGNLRASASKLK